jgi:SAM-dependent methyltransferase
LSKDAWLNWYPEREVEEGVRRFAQALKEASSPRVLDFGCGTGRNAVYLARFGFRMHGFDWS